MRLRRPPGVHTGEIRRAGNRTRRKPLTTRAPLAQGERQGGGMARLDRSGILTSATAVAAEALRTGVIPGVRRGARTRTHVAEIPREDVTIRVGDPDDRSLANEYVGDETPGGS